MIIKKLVVGPVAANCYIASSESTKDGMIVDPGAEAEDILKSVKEMGLEIKLIVLTHRHPDHIGALTEVRQATGAETASHTDTDETECAQPSPNYVAGPSYQAPPPADRLLKGGDSLDIGDLHFSVLHTPGHSPNSICLLGHGVVFSGDTLFNFSIGRYDLAGGNYHQLMNSLHTKLMVLPDDTIVYPGHGPDTTIGTERRVNPFLQD